ncbi:dnaJ homolog subfamily C member 16-like [Salvelinus fontinalis]|uniref:dnaJ homolog subfamily C member 16-like n=1 Tax=Salvelinus fontinalis TaxID=8038 RepID=UPI0024867C4D|nr:dnaJ homolog subfamily C member 16-like [Salvelinus fontinalis]
MGGLCRPLQSSMVWLAVLLLLLGETVNTAQEFDPYRVLGLTKSASQAEVKKVYKRLVREWHPDKNNDPGAEDMFIKITKSYEILGNVERRTNYDRYGQMEENKQGQHQQGFNRHFHSSFHFDESFFNFPRSGRDFSDSKYLLDHAGFNSKVLPDSFKRPYLIKITSEWCFACVHIEPVWRETVQELEPLGVGIGIVDIGYERHLANQLGVHRTPSILGVVNGRVTVFHYSVVREHLRQFVEDLLPQRLVEKVTDKNYVSFLGSWHVENNPSVLLFDQVPAVPLLYKLTAFAFKDYVRFGYVDQGLTETSRLLHQFNINSYAPTMLLFKENTEQPADIIQAKGMKRQIMEEFVSNNKYLCVPRLVNQHLFDELCPIKQFHRRRKYCVLLITGEEPGFVPGNQAFLTFASSNTKDVLRFTYVYQRQQQPLCQALLHNQAPLFAQVVILERRSPGGKAVYRSVIGGWNGSDDDKTRLHEQLELLQRDPSYLSYDATLPELNNELAPMFLIQWINAAYDYFLQIYDDLLFSNWREMLPILSLIFSALFILFGTVIIQAFSDSGEEKPPQKPKPKNPPKTDDSPGRANTSSRPPKKDFVEVTELTNITYISNLVKLRPGHINVVLVLTDASKNALLRKYAKEVFSFSGTQTLHFSFLNADKHSQWMPSLLESCPTAARALTHGEEEEEGGGGEGDEYSSPFSGRPRDFTGHVLALNGHKKYFCLFRPVFTGDTDTGGESSSSSSSSFDEGSRRKSRSRSRSQSSSRSRSREEGGSSGRGGRGGGRSSRATSLEVHHKLDRLGLWMERLMEGTLPRHSVPGWPGLDTTSPSSSPAPQN